MDGNAFFSYLLQQKQISKETSPYIHLDSLKQFLATFQQAQIVSTEKSQEKSAQDQSTWEREKEPFLPDSIEESNETSRYKFLEKLGQGGMGVVQLVQDSLLGRKVALKSIKTFNKKGLSRNQKIQLWRLHKEAEITAILEHPNIVPLYDLEKKPTGEINFTMRKVEGDTFKTILKSVPENKKEESKLLSILLKVCDAVAYAHNQLIVHRDLKPENIMVGEFGEVYVMDWGIAKKIEASHSNLLSNDPLFSFDQEFQEPLLEKTQEGTMATQEAQAADFVTRKGMGTLGYMAPEQMKEASSVTTQADIYSLGMILKECFLRYSPVEMFELELKSYQNQEDQGKTQISKTFESKIPTDMKAIIQKASASKQTERYHSVLEFKEDIEKYLENKQVSVRDYPILEILWKWSKRHRKNITLISVSVFIGVMAIFYLQWWKKQQLLKQHMSRLSYWIETLKDPQPGMRDMALLEISKMQENEVLHKMLKVLTQATNYFLDSTPKTPKRSEYYETMITALGWLENPNAGAPLLSTLQKLSNKVSKIPPKKRKLEQIDFMVALVQAIVTSKAYDNATKIAKISQEMGLESLFTQRIKLSYQKLLPYLIKHYSSLIEKNPQDIVAYNNRGLAFMEIGNLKSAIADYTEIIRINPQDIAAYNNRGLALSETGDLNSAIADFTEAIRCNPQCGSSYNNRGLAKLKTNNIKGAILDFDQAIHLHPQFGIAYQNRGKAHQRNQAYQKAILDFNQAIHLNPQTPFAYVTRGNIKVKIKDLEAALSDFNNAIKLNPEDATLYTSRGNIKSSNGNLKGAVADHTLAIQLEPQNGDFYTNRGLVRLRNGDFLGAISDHTESIRLKPQFAINYNNRGLAFQENGNQKRAISDFTKAIQFNPRYMEAYLNRGNSRAKIDDLKGALADFIKTIQLAPQHSKAYQNRGIIRSKLGDLEGAIADHTLAIQLNSEEPKNYNNRGIAKLESKDFKGALSDFNKAIHLNPQYVNAYINRGDLKSKTSDFKGALLDLNEAIRLNPKEKNAYNNRGLIKFKIGNLTEAILDFNKAIQLNPQNTEIYLNRGNVKSRSGDLKGAIEDFTKAISLKPQYSEAYNNRGVAHYNAKNFKAAIEDYTKAHHLNPQDALAIFNLAVTYQDTGEENKAIEFFEKGLLLQSPPGILDRLSTLLINRIVKYYRSKKYQKAKEEALRFLKSVPANHPNTPKINKMLQQIEKQLQKQKK